MSRLTDNDLKIKGIAAIEALLSEQPRLLFRCAAKIVL